MLALAVVLTGALGFFYLPLAPLPQIEFPTIQVSAALPGASPETMASSVATPLERQFGRIAGITQMTSVSRLGLTTVNLEFELDRNIDAAGRDVQAAINAARGQLPANLPSNPFYRKVNPADQSILTWALTSDVLPLSRVYDAADSILAQKVAQIPGVGLTDLKGLARPAVRVEVNPTLLSKLEIGSEQIRTALVSANENKPKGEFANALNSWMISDNDQLLRADQYRDLVVSNRNGATVRLQDVADVEDSVEDIRNLGLANGKLAVTMHIYRQPGANIVRTVDRVNALLPILKASIPPSIKIETIQERTVSIRASVKEIESALMLSVVLVVLVVFLFLGNPRATFIPSVAVPISLIGTFGAMYLLGYSLDNLSLMALAISAGFVVDDAIVVLEKITRYIEQGLRPVEAALRGAREIGFTVLSISVSLIAGFIPLLLMGGIVGRLIREFAVTMSVAITVSLLVSLTATPMMCAKLLKEDRREMHGRLHRWSDRIFDGILHSYAKMLQWVLRRQPLTLAITIATACLSVYLYVIVPKGFFPQQDVGRLGGTIQAAQDISFEALTDKMKRLFNIVMKEPAVEFVNGYAGSSVVNTASLNITLKPLEVRKESAEQFITRMRGKLATVPGATVFLQANQDLQIGARQSASQFQYTLQGENLEELNLWAPRVLDALRRLPELRDLSSDQQSHGLQARIVIDRDTASRLGIKAQAIDDALYDAFGQRQVATMYEANNQYHVVMEVAPRFYQNPDSLHDIYVQTANRTEVPLSTFTHFERSNTPLAVNHQGLYPAVTMSFNLAPGVALGQGTQAIEKLEQTINLPTGIHPSFQGVAKAFQSSLATEPWLILAALVTVYIVLGILYESYIHPITILSTLPSAGVGALLALLLTHNELNVIGLIGIVLLIGLVKKNAIMMIDFAIEAERHQGKSPVEAIYQACLLRFRPIIMTTMTAILGGVPLVLGTHTGYELRRPLGITIIGGLIVSQMLTLFTTPVVYLYMDRLRLWASRGSKAEFGRRLPLSPIPNATN